MVVRVLDHVDQCYTADDGAVISDLLKAALSAGDHVRLSFSGVNNAPSAFMNAAFGSLIDSFGPDYVRSHLAIQHVTPQIRDMILRRFARACSVHEAA